MTHSAAEWWPLLLQSLLHAGNWSLLNPGMDLATVIPGAQLSLDEQTLAEAFLITIKGDKGPKPPSAKQR